MNGEADDGRVIKKKVWFRAMAYGWGWGMPTRWEGWAVLLGYVVVLTGGLVIGDIMTHLVVTVVATAGLIGICWWKGERPGWRWGEEGEGHAKLNTKGLLFFHLLMGPLLLGFAIYVRTHLPEEINETYGYRTLTSMQSEEVWEAAQRFSANMMIAAAVLTIVYQGVSCLTMKPIVSLITSTMVLTVLLLLTIPATELYLNEHFDAAGRRIRVEAAGP